jgi:hypothetical protein
MKYLSVNEGRALIAIYNRDLFVLVDAPDQESFVYPYRHMRLRVNGCRIRKRPR